MLALVCLKCGMLFEEVICVVMLNGVKVMELEVEFGSIVMGKCGSFVFIVFLFLLVYLFYVFGIDLVECVYIDG